MEVVRNISQHFRKNLSLYFFAFLIIFTIDKHHRFEISSNSNIGPFEHDVKEYYSYLPVFFYQTPEEFTENLKQSKRTIGMAIMYSPAFFIGDMISQKKGEARNGYSASFQWAIRWESIIISILGLVFCRKSLLFFFKDMVVLLALICIFFGTNLFYYTYCVGEMPHSYLFFLYSIFIYLSLQFILENKSQNILLMGLVAGMITLIRPTDIIILLFPLLFNISSFTELKSRVKIISKNLHILLLALALFLIPLIIQISLWKKYTGHFIFYTYRNERFFFDDPQIFNFLLSYRKGWLVYTPVMIFSLLGILLSFKYLKKLFSFLVIFTILNIYILSCWWDWSYGGSFGCRALIQSYAVLIFPLALFISLCWELWERNKSQNLITRFFLVCILFTLIKLNIFQTWQSKWHILHWSGMNEKTYKFIFLKESLNKEERTYLSSNLTLPDYGKMIKGERDK